jgi:hypothetical protein
MKKNLSQCDDVTKRYYYVWISLHSGEKTIKECVKDFAYCCTEKRFHEICFDILQKMEKAGMTFNGKNANRYFELNSRECPPPDRIEQEISRLQKQVR